jgi:hypothetical protein
MPRQEIPAWAARLKYEIQARNPKQRGNLKKQQIPK